MIHTFTIPGRLPGLNDIIDAARKSKFASAEQKEEFTNLVAWLAKAARLPRMERIRVVIRWFEPNIKRDPDNIQAGQKFIFDGLVTAGVIKNDGWKQIDTPVIHHLGVDRDNPRVEIEITEA